MLWYKAWRETRARFAVAVLTLVWVCTVILVLQQQSRLHGPSPMSYSAYVWNAVYKDYVRDLFIVLTMVLGGGGLLQEQATGTAGFTLSLPTTRRRHVAVRGAVGVLEFSSLAFVPATVIPPLSAAVGQAYPGSQAAQFAILWACCGILVFGLAQLLATLVPGATSGWIVGFLTLMLYAAVLNVSALDRHPELDLFKIMSGAGLPYFSRADCAIVGPLPWIALGVIVASGIGCLFAAERVLASRDFA